jgi:hypothetical protein
MGITAYDYLGAAINSEVDKKIISRVVQYWRFIRRNIYMPAVLLNVGYYLENFVCCEIKFLRKNPHQLC